MSDEWATPGGLFVELNKEFQFTLDPCASPWNAKCPRYFTEEDDGLSKSWAHGVVWMNPPFGDNGRSTGRWVEKALRSARGPGRACVVCLLPAKTDTTWWRDVVMQADEIRFICGRLSFGSGRGRSPCGSAVVIYRPGRGSPLSVSVIDRNGKPATRQERLAL